MSARRTEIRLLLEGVDISTDISHYLLSMTYTDNEEDKTDDLQLSLEDRGWVWLGDWLNGDISTAGTQEKTDGWKIGDEVIVNGRPQYSSYGNGTPGATLSNYRGKITYLNLKSGIPYPIHVDQKGWFAESQVTKATEAETKTNGIKGAEISAVIIQRNWESTGRDRALDCGTFEVDTINGSGPPSKVTIKASSIPCKTTARTQKKTKAWEKIKLSVIANEIAGANGLSCMFESSSDPFYDRKEQMQESDITFLQRLCKDAGISLKVTAKMIVLFDTADYEQKDAVVAITRGAANVSRWSFSTSLHDTAFSSCHVSYTDPKSQTTIEYTYTPRDDNKGGQVLEINEKVSTREEARQLAMKRLRQKNKEEYKASFSLSGDTRLVAGVTVEVSDYGAFDGKYIIETATHTVSKSGGYKTDITLRRVLEGY